MINLQDYEKTKEGILLHPLNSQLLKRKHMDASNIKNMKRGLENAKATETNFLVEREDSWDSVTLGRFGLWFMTSLML